MYHGDLALGSTIDIKFTTRSFTTGAPTTLAGTPVISAYPDNSTTQLTAGITLSVDFDTVTGLHNVRVVATSGNGYATATNYTLVITTGTVGGVSVVGECIGSFSIEARSSLRPTTAGRTLDVSTGGEAGLDWANIGSPTTANNLSATNIDVDQVVASVSGAVGSVTGLTAATVHSDLDDIQTRLPAALVSGRIDASVGAVAANAITAASIADGAIDRATFAVDTGLQPIRSNTAQAGAATTITLDASASAVDNFYNNTLILLTGGTGVGQARFITAYVGATKVATVATWVTNPDVTSTFAILPFDAVAGASVPTTAQIATAVWQDLLASSDFGTAASIGKLLKDDIDAAITSRMATYTQPTGFLAATFPSGTVANTTNITDGTITTVTNLTNAPTSGDLTATMKASVNTEVDTAIADARLDELLAADSDIDGATPPTVGSVFHELLTKTAGSFTYDQATDSLEAIRDKETDIETDTAEIGAAGAGLTNINLPDQTMDIVGNITGNLSGSVGSVVGAVGSVTGAVGSVTGLTASNLDTTISSRATPVQVNAEVVDALNVDTYAEVGQETPAATQTIRKMLAYLYKAWRNRSTQTATEYKLYNDDAVTVAQKSTVSDDTTTFDSGEKTTGP